MVGKCSDELRDGREGMVNNNPWVNQWIFQPFYPSAWGYDCQRACLGSSWQYRRPQFHTKLIFILFHIELMFIVELLVVRLSCLVPGSPYVGANYLLFRVAIVISLLLSVPQFSV